jgi:hypothetical protein
VVVVPHSPVDYTPALCYPSSDGCIVPFLEIILLAILLLRMYYIWARFKEFEFTVMQQRRRRLNTIQYPDQLRVSLEEHYSA